ncbi:H-NS histone family protein [Azohydromonas lata]|uniref:H-NS histone family protein n=1 Tax=Azohydromonas lata TaxID=45677 RepID=A0ABU5IAP2_9BURK|nr:H-NS histone family protein [Azohydromonas lata]MDZ5456038.1 H-NS histone family protein [Azohydromonas lata]
MANIQDLLKQREDLERQIKQLQENSRSEAINTIKELMAQNNLSVEDLTSNARGSKKGETGGKTGTVAPKYQDPASGKTWTGRGLKPKWVTEALESGKSLDDLAIKA